MKRSLFLTQQASGNGLEADDSREVPNEVQDFLVVSGGEFLFRKGILLGCFGVGHVGKISYYKLKL